MRELEDDDTLRLPVAGYPNGPQKKLRRNGNTAGRLPTFLDEDLAEEADFLPERKRELDSRCSLKERRRMNSAAGERPWSDEPDPRVPKRRTRSP